MKSIPNPIPLAAIEAARERIRGSAIRTPLVRLHVDAPCEIWLKLECLQPIGSFKIRGASNAIARMSPEELREGVVTASAGNMAQGVAWCARERGISCRVIVPEHAPEAKTAAVERLGASVIRRPFNEWWDVLMTHDTKGVPGAFVHPVVHEDVIAGNGTIGLEILEELEEVDAVVVPYGGGGLSCGIASAIKARRPATLVYAAEVATAAPLAASLSAGRSVPVEYTASFVDGIGGRTVLEEMWPMARSLLAGSIVCSLEEISDALRVLVQRARVVAEGAGATGVAAARSGKAGTGRVVCVVSGGNIDLARLADVLMQPAAR